MDADILCLFHIFGYSKSRSKLSESTQISIESASGEFLEMFPLELNISSHAYNPRHDVMQAQKLRKELWTTKEYDRDLIPISRGRVVDVSTNLRVVEVSDFDAVKEWLNVLVWVEMNWTDARLAWRPDDWGGVESLRVNADSI